MRIRGVGRAEFAVTRRGAFAYADATMARLSDDEITERLARLSGWELAGKALRKSFDRGDFVGSVEFVRSIVGPAEEMNHHPDINISWSQVEVTLTTHSEGGLTDKDFELAAKIDELAG